MRGRERPEGDDIYWVFVPGVVLPSYCWSPIDSWLPSTSDHSHDLSERPWHSEYISLDLSLHDASLYKLVFSDIQRLYEKSSSVITLRAHSKLKGTVHWWMSIVIICFCTVAAQNRFDFHYFFCGVQKEVFSTMSMLLLSMSWKWIVAITVKI